MPRQIFHSCAGLAGTGVTHDETMRLARPAVEKLRCGSRASSSGSASASSSILADLAAGKLRTGSRSRSTRSTLPHHSGRVTLADWSHLEALAGGLRAPMAVRIKDLVQSAEDLTPSKSLRNAQVRSLCCEVTERVTM